MDRIIKIRIIIKIIVMITGVSDGKKTVSSPNKKLCYGYVSQNLVNCRNNLYDKSTTNRSCGIRGLQLTDLYQTATTRSSHRCRQQARPSTTTTTSFVDNAIDLPR